METVKGMFGLEVSDPNWAYRGGLSVSYRLLLSNFLSMVIPQRTRRPTATMRVDLVAKGEDKSKSWDLLDDTSFRCQCSAQKRKLSQHEK